MCSSETVQGFLECEEERKRPVEDTFLNTCVVSALVRYLDKNSWIVLIVIFLTHAATRVHNVVCGIYSDHVAVVTHKQCIGSFTNMR